MVYRNYHCEKNNSCDDDSCTALTAYVRIQGKWTRIGYYGSLCKNFEPLDLQQEKEDRELKLRLEQIKSDIRQFKNGNYHLKS